MMATVMPLPVSEGYSVRSATAALCVVALGRDQTARAGHRGTQGGDLPARRGRLDLVYREPAADVVRNTAGCSSPRLCSADLSACGSPRVTASIATIGVGWAPRRGSARPDSAHAG